MAKTTAEARPENRRVAQGELANLIGWRVSQVKDRSDMFVRGADGLYDLKQCIAAVMAEPGKDFAVAELPDHELHVVLVVADGVSLELDTRRDAALRVLRKIKRREGAAGLAAIGQAVIDRLTADEGKYSFAPKPDPTPAQIRAEAERKIAELHDPDRFAFAELRLLDGCFHCKSHYFAGKWRKGPLPQGYVSSLKDDGGHPLDLCDQCEAKKAAERMRLTGN